MKSHNLNFKIFLTFTFFTLHFAFSIFISTPFAYSSYFESDSAKSDSMGKTFVSLGSDTAASEINPAGIVQIVGPEAGISILSRNQKNVSAGANAGINNFESKNVSNWREIFSEPKEILSRTMQLQSFNLVLPFAGFAIATNIYQISQYKYNLNIGGGEYKNTSITNTTDDWQKTITVPHLNNEYLITEQFVPTISIATEISPEMLVGISFKSIPVGETYFVNKFPENEWLDFEWLDKSGKYNIPLPARLPMWFEPAKTYGWTLGTIYKPLLNLNFGVTYKWVNPVDMKLTDWEKRELNNPITTYVSGNSKYTYRYYPITSDFSLKLPQHLAGGISYKPDDNLTLAAQVNWIEYSSLDWDTSDDWAYTNATEYHFGIEYSLNLELFYLPIRLGFYTEPYGLDYYIGNDSTMKSRYGKPEDRYNITCGLGITREQWSFDISFDFELEGKKRDIYFSPVFYF